MLRCAVHRRYGNAERVLGALFLPQAWNAPKLSEISRKSRRIFAASAGEFLELHRRTGEDFQPRCFIHGPMAELASAILPELVDNNAGLINTANIDEPRRLPDPWSRQRPGSSVPTDHERQIRGVVRR